MQKAITGTFKTLYVNRENEESIITTEKLLVFHKNLANINASKSKREAFRNKITASSQAQQNANEIKNQSKLKARVQPAPKTGHYNEGRKVTCGFNFVPE